MHRMRHSLRLTGLVLALALAPGLTRQTSADLIRPEATRSYPDIAADINGRLDYVYDSGSNTGLFTLTNTPFLLAAGPELGKELSILPTADGTRKQSLTVKLDGNGNVVTDPGNLYQLYGSITTAGGQQTTGLLLEGTPTVFGSEHIAAKVGGSSSDKFDFGIAITGGALADYFGEELYMLVRPEINSTFQGSLAQSFSAEKATSNTRTYDQVIPFPVPEPSTLLMLATGGVLLFGRGFMARRRGR